MNPYKKSQSCLIVFTILSILFFATIATAQEIGNAPPMGNASGMPPIPNPSGMPPGPPKVNLPLGDPDRTFDDPVSEFQKQQCRFAAGGFPREAINMDRLALGSGGIANVFGEKFCDNIFKLEKIGPESDISDLDLPPQPGGRTLGKFCESFPSDDIDGQGFTKEVNLACPAGASPNTPGCADRAPKNIPEKHEHIFFSKHPELFPDTFVTGTHENIIVAYHKSDCDPRKFGTDYPELTPAGFYDEFPKLGSGSGAKRRLEEAIKALQKAEQKVTELETALEEAKQTLTLAQNEKKEAQKALDEEQTLLVAAQAALKQAQTRLTEAQTELKAAQEEQQSAQQEVTAGEAKVKELGG